MNPERFPQPARRRRLARVPALFSLKIWVDVRRIAVNLRKLSWRTLLWRRTVGYLVFLPLAFRILLQDKARAPELILIVANSRHGTNRLMEILAYRDSHVNLREAFHPRLDGFIDAPSSPQVLINRLFGSQQNLRFFLSVSPGKTLAWMARRLPFTERVFVKVFPGHLKWARLRKVTKFATAVIFLSRNPVAAAASAEQAQMINAWSSVNTKDFSVVLNPRKLLNRIVATFELIDFCLGIAAKRSIEITYRELCGLSLAELRERFGDLSPNVHFTGQGKFRKQDERKSSQRLTNYKVIEKILSEVGLDSFLNTDVDYISRENYVRSLELLETQFNGRFPGAPVGQKNSQ